MVLRPVRAVTVRAFHQSFRNTVMKWLRELRTCRAMTRVAQARLRFLQQALAQPSLVGAELRNGEEVRERGRWRRRAGRSDRLHQMRRMARLTRHGGACMLRVFERLLTARCRMARQTPGGVLL